MSGESDPPRSMTMQTPGRRLRRHRRARNERLLHGVFGSSLAAGPDIHLQ